MIAGCNGVWLCLLFAGSLGMREPAGMDSLSEENKPPRRLDIGWRMGMEIGGWGMGGGGGGGRGCGGGW